MEEQTSSKREWAIEPEDVFQVRCLLGVDTLFVIQKDDVHLIQTFSQHCVSWYICKQ